MKRNNEFRNVYQAWRMLDHFLGKDLPATRYLTQRDRILELFLAKKKNEITNTIFQKQTCRRGFT